MAIGGVGSVGPTGSEGGISLQELLELQRQSAAARGGGGGGTSPVKGAAKLAGSGAAAYKTYKTIEAANAAANAGASASASFAPEVSSGLSEALSAQLAGPTLQNAAALEGAELGSAATAAESAAAAEGGAAAGANAASGGTPNFSMGSPSYAGYLGAAMGAVNAYNNWDNVPDDMKATYAQQQAALAVANVYTGGMAGIAEGFARKRWGGTMAKLDKLDQKYNPLSVALNKTSIFGGKNKDQQVRDSVRKELKNANFLDDKWNVTLADGSKFDVGKDGKHRGYNVDLTREGMGDIVAAVQPLGAIIAHGQPKSKSDFTGYLSNAAASSGNPLDNVRKFYSQLGVSRDSAIANINSMEVKGALDKESAQVYRGAVNLVFDPNVKELPKTPYKPPTAEATTIQGQSPKPIDRIIPK